MSGLLQDVRSTWRAFRKWPGVYSVIILTLALGIGINTMFFTFFSGMVLRPLPFKDPARLVLVNESQPKLEQTQRAVSAANLRDWREQATVFESIGAFTQGTFDLHSTDNPERVRGASVSADVFPMLGLTPVMGRQISADEDRPGGQAVVLISHSLWERRFASDPNIVSRKIYLNDRPHEIVGVMPAGVKFPHFAELWTPLALDPADVQRDRRRLEVMARLAPGVSVSRAQQEMSAIATRLAERYPDTNTGWSVRLRSLRDAWLPPVTRFSALAQQIQVAFVLLIACANVANLMLAQAAMRRYEIALRSAIGATRRRLIRQFLTEGVVLALVGGLVGTAVAMFGDTWLRALVQIPIPYWLQFSFDRSAFVFAIAITLVAGIGFSLIPALRYTGPDLVDALKVSGRPAEGRKGNRLRRVLVVAQFVMSAVLLVGALLMITSFLRLKNASPGYQAANVLTMRLSLNGEEYRDPKRRVAFLDKATREIGGLATVSSAGAVSFLPSSNAGYDAVQVEAEGQQAQRRDEARAVARHAVTGSYLETLKIPLVDGRGFTDTEINEGRDVVIVSSRLARQLWPNRRAIDQRIRFVQTQAVPWLTVVGVAGDIQPGFQISGLDAWPRTQLYVPYGSNPTRLLSFAVQTKADPTSVATDLRNQLQRIDPTVPIYDVYSMAQVLDLVNWVPKLWGQLFSLFGIMALLMAAAGTYSANAYLVSRRTHEIGIRMAMGAQPKQILGLVLREALTVCAIGTIIGIAMALPMALFLRQLLVGMTALNPIVFGGVALLLIVVSAIAASAPAYRAIRVNPTIALRSE